MLAGSPLSGLSGRAAIVKIGAAPATAVRHRAMQRCDRAWAGRRAPRRKLSNFDLSAVCAEHVLRESTTNHDMEPFSRVYSAKIGHIIHCVEMVLTRIKPRAGLRPDPELASSTLSGVAAKAPAAGRLAAAIATIRAIRRPIRD